MLRCVIIRAGSADKVICRQRSPITRQPRLTTGADIFTVRLLCFTQIKLAGFKSFVEPTVIPTPSQLVGVVGPNGCGKSNIIDAVRWVLGETRASELRGESHARRHLQWLRQPQACRQGVCRAAVFDNSEGRAAGQWSTYSEIAVRRVLTRDGTSSYLVNNQQVRRRDIHDIFLGTGLGSRGYAIIGQGMINQLHQPSPKSCAFSSKRPLACHAIKSVAAKPKTVWAIPAKTSPVSKTFCESWAAGYRQTRVSGRGRAKIPFSARRG